MISFRYFLTSLVAVFLALAVGMVLGAGPLKEAIGNSLTGRVNQLTTEVNNLETSLTSAESQLGVAEKFVAGAAATLVPGSLTERRVAVISLGAQDELVAAATSSVSAAGGEVSTVVRIEAGWNDEAKSAFRQQLASTLTTYLDPVPAVGAVSDEVLGTALVQALTATSATDASVRRVNTDLIIELLVKAELVTVPKASTVPVDAIVIVGVPSTSTAATASQAPWVALATSSAAIAPTVVVAGAQTQVVDALVQAKAKVTTVAGAQGGFAAVTVPLALGSTISGTVGTYGPGMLPAKVELTAPQRVPTPVTVSTPGANPPAGGGQG